MQTVRRTFQVDRYLPKTAAQAKALVRFDDDGRLAYREDAILWGASRHQFVTVTVPMHATAAQLIAAINAATNKQVGDVRTTKRLSSATRGSAYVVAWELGAGASARAPWGASRKVAQTFAARS